VGEGLNRVSGLVTDETGAVIAGAAELLRPDSSAVQTTVESNLGRRSFGDLHRASELSCGGCQLQCAGYRPEQHFLWKSYSGPLVREWTGFRYSFLVRLYG
jgi:hypothetical protein